MRLALRIASLAVVASLFAGAAPAETLTYSAVLTGDQEVPPSGSTAAGGAAFVLDTTSKLLSYSLATQGTFTETAAHIHGPAPVGENANILFPLNLGAVAFGVVGPLTDQQIADLDAGLLYVNVHSSAHPGGEIRGQIVNIVAVQPSTWSQVKALYSH